MFLRIILLIALLLSVVPSALHADELPLWEAGFGLTGLSLPDYRGSDQQRAYIFPLPYPIYRGEILRMDRKGWYGILFHSSRIQLNVSGDGNVPVNSARNDARKGMPNLDATGQFGPSIDVCLLSKCDGDSIAQFRLVTRAVFATDFTYISSIGYVVNPQINFDYSHLGADRVWNSGFALGPLFATGQFHRYYYEVSPQYSIPGVRPAYDAPGGYSGSLLIFTLSRRFNDLWFGAFAQYDNLSGAAFSDSPLVKTKQSFRAGIGLAWIFGRSVTLVESPP